MKDFYRKFDKLIIERNSTFLQAMKLIEKNKKGFVVVVEDSDHGNFPIGTLTDGDIRRELISGKNVDDKISFNVDFKYVEFGESFSSVCRTFREFNLDFLLIIKDNSLFNFFTKKQFYIMLLDDISYKPDIDYFSFDEKRLDHEIYNRPWGFYKSVLLSSHVQSKIITIFPDSEISLQKHKYREEHWVIMKGVGKIMKNNTEMFVRSGSYVHIPKECKHQIINTSADSNLVLTEVQLGEYFGEDDIVRYSDKYGRV